VSAATIVELDLMAPDCIGRPVSSQENRPRNRAEIHVADRFPITER